VFAVVGLGGAGLVALGPAGAMIATVLLLVLVGFTGAVVFSRREEPIKRLLKLIKALWRDR
jgi:hypothetical protein